MRHQVNLAAIVGLLAWSAPIFAQSEATLLQDVEVRSGPSKSMYPTSKLQRGYQVIVVRECKETPGWLEIKPPAGSFSWINGKYVKIIGPYAIVNVDASQPAPVLPGSNLVEQQPNREITKLAPGSILVMIDKVRTINSDVWVPVQPHPSEVRYIPKEAVQPTTPVGPITASATNWAVRPDGYTTNQTIAEAERALQAGDVARARDLFLQVQANSTDTNQKIYAMNKLNTPPLSSSTQAQTASLQKAPFTAFSPSPTSLVGPASAPGKLLTLQSPAWSAYGRLRDTTLQESGQPVYVLEDAQGRALAYVMTSTGKSLQQYSGRTVAVYGPTVYRTDSAVRLNYIVASHVSLP